MNFENSLVEQSFIEMPKDEPFICSFSGGKDSALALSMACEKGEAKAIIHWCNKEKNTSIFHSQDLSIINCQAEHMNLPVIIANYTPWKHRVQLLRTYKELACKGIKSIVFGDINEIDSAKMQYILCHMAGLIPRYPLWNKTYNDLFMEIKSRRIKTVITRVNTAMLSSEWLGHVFDEKVYNTFCQMGIDPFGEKGEFHTTVVDADVFISPINYCITKNKGIDNEIILQLSSHYCVDNIYHI
ncbi:MAG: hypothetical protein ACLTC0_07375 [Eisenbergiella massiliensis]|uniref:Dph6-related ATP pyrophosphatase n=1 Tax=Eisenbergiella massiliensis TaxID=1720294 RepID=UPI00399261B5